jgi:heat-inducible transcriptional repressor
MSPPVAWRPASLQDLDRRAREIFREIVDSYLESGEPVGSRTISRRGVNLSPASIRNTMADLATAGLLDAPHASAGRTPTQLGLRLFVDGLLGVGEMPAEERQDIETRLAGAGRDVSSVLSEASSLLSGIAGGAGLVVTPAREAPLRHVELVYTGGGQGLAVLVFADGQIENRIMTLPAGMTSAGLAEASNFLNARLRGRTLTEAKDAIVEDVRRTRELLDAAAAEVIEQGLAEWSGGDPLESRKLIVRGRANLLSDAAAAQDLERVKRLFDDLEHKRELVQILDLARDADAVKIFIGSENPMFSLSGSALIVAPYMDAERRVIGALGVIGPTRLNYARIIPMVDYTARVVGRLVGHRAGLTGDR